MFNFSLQTALDVRKRQEKIKMKELAEKLALEQNIQHKISVIHDQIQKVDKDSNRKKQGLTFSINEMRLVTDFKRKKAENLGYYHQELTKAVSQVKQKQTDLIEASRARKTLEILKDKEAQKFQARIAREERIFMDEIAVNYFTRNKRNNPKTQ